MSLLAAIRKLWHSIVPRTHRDVEEEFRSTLDAYQEDLIRQGLPEEDSRSPRHLPRRKPLQYLLRFLLKRLSLSQPYCRAVS